ncbi:MAG: hypothetical protein K8W52_46650 [Deltaproteobacteria bacterium]|nr:hypothetical protein [Deltaproteobacteria bacterium]
MSDPGWEARDARAPLARAVDDEAPRRQVARRTRRTIALAFGGTSLLFLALAQTSGAPDAIAVVVPVAAPPIVVPPVIVRPAPQVLAIPVLVAPPIDDPACPVPPVPDRAIGRPVSPGVYDDRADAEAAQGIRLEPVVEVAASARRPVIAVRVADEAWASIDDGAHFRQVLASDEPIRAIAIDDDGRIYAATDTRLGIRDPRGAERWELHASATGDREREPAGALIAVGRDALWVGDGQLLVSRAGGRWRAQATPDGRFDDLVGGRAWDGVIYRGGHIQDMCGLDDYVASSYALGGELESATFHAGGGGPVLETLDDTGASWRYRLGCVRGGDDPTESAPCEARDPRRRARSLMMAQLQPTIGARALFVERGTLVELCGLRAHPIAHAFGDDPIVAVDGGGRPLVIRDGHLWRWSPRYGWRELFRGATGATWSGDGE